MAIKRMNKKLIKLKALEDYEEYGSKAADI
jgi:hypothetical protein